MSGKAARRRRRAAARTHRGSVAAPVPATSHVTDEHLPPWDRGPVRAHLRDVVDGAGRNLTLWWMPFFALALITVAGPPSELSDVLRNVSFAALALLTVEVLIRGRLATLSARRAFPDRQVNAVSSTFYWFMRAHRPRSMRKPAPQVRRGEKPIGAG